MGPLKAQLGVPLKVEVFRNTSRTGQREQERLCASRRIGESMEGWVRPGGYVLSTVDTPPIVTGASGASRRGFFFFFSGYARNITATR